MNFYFKVKFSKIEEKKCISDLPEDKGQWYKGIGAYATTDHGGDSR